jgi:hypothetical protein
LCCAVDGDSLSCSAASGSPVLSSPDMRCLLRHANLLRRFWPYAMLHFCRVYAYWPDKQGKSAWEKLDSHGPHALCHDEARDLHRFGSYVTGHLPRTHHLVENETLDDRDLEGVWLGNDLSTPVFWMYSFKLRKVVRLSDPRHLDHILPFLCPEDIPHRIDLSANDMAYRLPSIVATGKATSARSALTVSPVMPFNRMGCPLPCAPRHTCSCAAVSTVP